VAGCNSRECARLASALPQPPCAHVCTHGLPRARSVPEPRSGPSTGKCRALGRSPRPLPARAGLIWLSLQHLAHLTCGASASMTFSLGPFPLLSTAPFKFSMARAALEARSNRTYATARAWWGGRSGNFPAEALLRAGCCAGARGVSAPLGVRI